MGRYIIRRVAWMFVLMFAIVLITFIIFQVFPTGDPALNRAGRGATPERIQQIREVLGTDKPLPVQFFQYLTHLVKGPNGWFDLGYSYQNNVVIRQQIFSRLPVTALLTLGAAVVWLAIGIPIGVISAIKRRTLADRASMVFALFGISAPVYWLGLLGLFLVGADIGIIKIFPGQGAYLSAANAGTKLWALFLPWFVLAMAFAASYARYMRAGLLEVMGEDYIRTARAKGLAEKTVIFKHGLRSAITPIVTIFGLDVGSLLGGAILTESVFNIPGIGRYAFDAISNGDLPVIQGTVVFGAFFIVLANLIVDIAYAFLDPRVRYT